MAIILKWRRDTAANWTSNNPTLAQGEPGFETDTGKYKVGDGTTAWNSLSYGAYSTNAVAALFTDVGASDPAAPASGKLLLYAKSIAGRMMLKQIGPSGLSTAIQPFLARNKVGYFVPPGSAATLPAVFGYASPTLVGTNTAAPVSTTNTFTRMRRFSLVSSATAGSLASFRCVVQVSFGDGQGNGGFYKIIRFGCSDPATVSGARQFVGISTTANAPTNVEPSTLTNVVGVGNGAADTTLSLYYAGSTVQTPINLGANFPANTLSADAYELALFSPSNQFNTLYYEVTNIGTGNVATGVLIGDGQGIAMPSVISLLNYSWNYRTNNATALSVGLDIMSDYIETDN